MLVSVFTSKVQHVEFKGFNYKYINGAMKNKKHCAGYCDCDMHRGCLTEKQMKMHKCISKECTNLYTYIEDWNHIKKEVVIKEDYTFECRKLTSEVDGMKVLSAEKKDEKLKVRYTSICSIDEKKLVELICSKYHESIVEIECIDMDFEKSVEIIYGRI